MARGLELGFAWYSKILVILKIIKFGCIQLHATRFIGKCCVAIGQMGKGERRRVQYNLKVKNIITSALGMDEYFRVSNCKNAKEMWDTLQVTHEVTTDVKRSRINTLTHEYELFRMNQNETIQDIQKRFTHIVNHLASLEKIFHNEDFINKVLRCLSSQWQPRPQNTTAPGTRTRP